MNIHLNAKSLFTNMHITSETYLHSFFINFYYSPNNIYFIHSSQLLRQRSHIISYHLTSSHSLTPSDQNRTDHHTPVRPWCGWGVQRRGGGTPRVSPLRRRGRQRHVTRTPHRPTEGPRSWVRHAGKEEGGRFWSWIWFGFSFSFGFDLRLGLRRGKVVWIFGTLVRVCN